jgi:hypothetical protein
MKMFYKFVLCPGGLRRMTQSRGSGLGFRGALVRFRDPVVPFGIPGDTLIPFVNFRAQGIPGIPKPQSRKTSEALSAHHEVKHGFAARRAFWNSERKLDTTTVHPTMKPDIPLPRYSSISRRQLSLLGLEPRLET